MDSVCLRARGCVQESCPSSQTGLPQSMIEGEQTWLLAKETLFYDQMLHPRPSISIITREDFYH